MTSGARGGLLDGSQNHVLAFSLVPLNRSGYRVCLPRYNKTPPRILRRIHSKVPIVKLWQIKVDMKVPLHTAQISGSSVVCLLESMTPSYPAVGTLTTQKHVTVPLV